MARNVKFEEARLQVIVTGEFHARMKAVCRRERTAMTQLARTAIADRVEYLEAKHRAEDERAAAEREARRLGRKGFRRISNNPMGPGELDEPRPGVAVEAEELPLVYAQQAARIFDGLATGSPNEARLRLAEAIAAVRRYLPLTHPPDAKIAAILEGLVVRRREEAQKSEEAMGDVPVTGAGAATTPSGQPRSPPMQEGGSAAPERSPTSGADDALIIDPSKIRTYGNVA